MKIKTFILFVWVLANASCNNPGPKINDNNSIPQISLPYHVDLEKNLNNIRQIPLSIIGKDLKYIPLETKPNCLLQKINKIEFSSNYIFVLMKVSGESISSPGE
jgi:hypothetical protein